MNVAPRHLTAKAETLLSATLIHEVQKGTLSMMLIWYTLHSHQTSILQVMHVLGFDPHAFAHFRDERKRRRTQVFTLHPVICWLLFNKLLELGRRR